MKYILDNGQSLAEWIKEHDDDLRGLARHAARCAMPFFNTFSPNGITNGREIENHAYRMIHSAVENLNSPSPFGSCESAYIRAEAEIDEDRVLNVHVRLELASLFLALPEAA